MSTQQSKHGLVVRQKAIAFSSDRHAGVPNALLNLLAKVSFKFFLRMHNAFGILIAAIDCQLPNRRLLTAGGN